MPAQRMTLHLYAALPEPFRGGHGFTKSRFAFFRLITAPVKGKGAVVEQCQPFFHSFPKESLFLFILCFHQLHGIKSTAAEKELMGNLVNADFLADSRGSVGVQDTQTGICLTVS